MKQSSGEISREDAKTCPSLNEALVPRTQRSVTSTVRRRAGAHASARQGHARRLRMIVIVSNSH